MRWLLLALVGCQLGDDPDPPKCDAGNHVELGRCVADENTQQAVTIAGCVFTPELLVVRSGESFQFDNTDDVAREVRGPDGDVWSTVPPKRRSDFILVEKRGTWSYTAVGCPKGGSVKVE